MAGKTIADMDYGSYRDLMKSIDKAKGKKFKPIKIKDPKAVEKMSKAINKADGGVVNTTKAMPVGMMDGGKVKPMKMNMGGVAKGRGGMFKGIR